MSGGPRATIGWHQARRVAVPLALVAVAALMVFQVFTRVSLKPASVPEAIAGELIARDGRMYRTNQAEPFTGALIERYPNGALKSRSMLVAGFLDGASEGWYTNGQMEVREHFKAGVSHGVRAKWYPLGTLMSESSIEEGQHHGTFRRWHENGQLAEVVQMKHGRPEGVSLAYYENGSLKARTRILNGQVVEQKFWKEGELPPDSPGQIAQSP